MLFLDLSEGAVRQISANFRPGKVSPKAYLQCQDLVPLAGKLRHLIMGGHPTTSGWKNLFLDFLAFFSPKGHFRCANVLAEKTYVAFLCMFQNHNDNSHFCFHSSVTPKFGKPLSSFRDSAANRKVFGSPFTACDSKANNGITGMTMLKPASNSNIHAIESNAHKHVLKKLRQQLQSKIPAQHCSNLTATPCTNVELTVSVMAGICTYSIYSKLF